jgi:V/A-type H+-transporting ATPase subunit A
VTIGGTVSPAGGNFEEPVTQSTLKVVGAFHGLSRERSDARRFPAISPLESWSKYPSLADELDVALARQILRRGNEVNQMMKVVGEEGTSKDDFVTYLKSEYLDAVYLQQDAYHEVDAATPADRQRHVFHRIATILKTETAFPDQRTARQFYQKLTQTTRDWNRVARETPEFKNLETRIEQMVAEVTDDA